MTRRGLIHDSASGPMDFSGPRCIFPFRSSAFLELGHFGASARLRASARPRVFIVSSRLGVTHHPGTNVHIHTSKTLNLDFRFIEYAKPPSRLGRKSRSLLSKAASTGSKTVFRYYRGMSTYRRAICLIVY